MNKQIVDINSTEWIASPAQDKWINDLEAGVLGGARSRIGHDIHHRTGRQGFARRAHLHLVREQPRGTGTGAAPLPGFHANGGTIGHGRGVSMCIRTAIRRQEPASARFEPDAAPALARGGTIIDQDDSGAFQRTDQLHQ